jgi:hypothetical protein
LLLDESRRERDEATSDDTDQSCPDGKHDDDPKGTNPYRGPHSTLAKSSDERTSTSQPGPCPLSAPRDRVRTVRVSIDVGAFVTRTRRAIVGRLIHYPLDRLSTVRARRAEGG